MCAFTLLVSRAFSRAALHASSRHSGNTLDVKASAAPVGAQTGPLAPPVSVVSCLRFAPSASATQSCPPEVYATRRPSGDQRASAAFVLSSGNWRAGPPAVGITYVRVVRLFAARSVLRAA